MPLIIDYQTVFPRLIASGLTCTYFNSGSFAPRSSTGQRPAEIIAWTLAADQTIRPEMQQHVRVMSSLSRLMDRLTHFWTDYLPGELWVMPASHWAYELTDGNPAWLPATLQTIGIDPAALSGRNDGSAIAFDTGETNAMRTFVGNLLTRVRGSDFTAAWPGRATVALLHHHGQVWWRTPEPVLAEALRISS